MFIFNIIFLIFLFCMQKIRLFSSNPYQLRNNKIYYSRNMQQILNEKSLTSNIWSKQNKYLLKLPEILAL